MPVEQKIMRADRLVAIVLLLQARKNMTAQALARQLEVSPRTILRDVEALSIAGIPIYASGGRGGGIKLDERYRVSLTGMNETEIHTFFVASNAQLLKDIGLADAAKNALLKLSAAVPTHYQPSIEFMRQRIYIDPLWWWHETEPQPFLGEIQQAVYESRHLHGIYEHFDGSIAEHILEPYGLVAKSSTWYLIARRDGVLRTYRIARFKHIALLDTHFLRSDDFDLATHWQQHLQEFTATFSGYAFTLRFHEDRLPFIRRLMPGRYSICEPGSEDGWMTAQFYTESIDLAKMLIFGLGTQVIIVEPQELHTAVMQAACDILNK
ncbi:transcriptional regulator [Ktedonobacteria bacterium brp13]|nr:transcriptional regulator [Ktedonobacteria bacterium brp13]